MSEKLNHNPEHQENLNALIGISDKLLGPRPAQPGSAYEPKMMPFSWLLKGRSESRVIGYSLSDAYEGIGDDIGLGTPEERIADLSVRGLIKAYDRYITSGAWTAHLLLGEFREAKLIGRRVEPVGAERLLKLAIMVIDKQKGKDLYPFEKFIYSPEELLDHTLNDSIRWRLAQGIGEKDPLKRAAMWLKGKDPDIPPPQTEAKG